MSLAIRVKRNGTEKILKQETHYERPARHSMARHGPNGPNGKQLRVTHYERPTRQITARRDTATERKIKNVSLGINSVPFVSNGQIHCDHLLGMLYFPCFLGLNSVIL